MINIKKLNISGMYEAVYSMRNPMNSWSKGDTIEYPGDRVKIGENDLNLAHNLVFAGDDHGKLARFITVYVDINAPLYWWKEFDTYKVGTVANSCSTMHKIQEKEFTLDDFSHEHLNKNSTSILNSLIRELNMVRRCFNTTKSKGDWWQMIQLLPSSYNQKRTVMLNYQVLKHMYFARKDHKLDEWHTFCIWVETLPYAKELIIGDINK